MCAAPRRSRRDGREPSRKPLLRAAVDCFARLGYQGTTIDRIARDAGVTKGAVYYHFRDKEQLRFEAVKDHVGEFERQVLAEGTPERDARAALRRVLAVRSCRAQADTQPGHTNTTLVVAPVPP